MTVEEYLSCLKELSKNTGAYNTEVQVETEDGYIITVKKPCHVLACSNIFY